MTLRYNATQNQKRARAIGKLGAPSEQVQALMVNTRRPESLPVLARETRSLIQKALDDIHLELTCEMLVLP